MGFLRPENIRATIAGHKGLLAGLAIFVLIPICLMSYGVYRLREDSCYERPISYMFSPDHLRFVAKERLDCASGFGGGGTYLELYVGSGKPGNDKGELVFVSDPVPPDLRWIDNRHLAVTINFSTWIGKSIHKIDDIDIAYHVSEQAEQHFKEDITELNVRRDLYEHEPAQTTLGIEAMELAIEALRVKYQKFMEWKKDNASN
jgi:hypothetical protein